MKCYISDVEINLIGLNEKEKNFLQKTLKISPQKTKNKMIFKFGEKFNLVNSLKSVKLNAAIYNTVGDKCYVKQFNGDKAIWNFRDNEYIFCNKFIYKNLRNWFFANILDPFSIGCINYDKIIIHGSLWKYKEKGIIVCGNSGSGKSTLSLLLKNYVRVLSDDVLVLSKKNNIFYVEPINVGYGIHKNLFDEFDLTEKQKKEVLAENDKKIYIKQIYDDYICEEIELNKIIILKKNSARKTTIETGSDYDNLLSFINLQTNIPNPLFFKKYQLIKSIINNVNITNIKYSDICDVKKLKQVITGEL